MKLFEANLHHYAYILKRLITINNLTDLKTNFENETF